MIYIGDISKQDFLVLKGLAESSLNILEFGVGASTLFDNFGLRVAKMHNGKISRIEVIRSIH